jgi:hypothetical protein
MRVKWREAETSAGREGGVRLSVGLISGGKRKKRCFPTRTDNLNLGMGVY